MTFDDPTEVKGSSRPAVRTLAICVLAVAGFAAARPDLFGPNAYGVPRDARLAFALAFAVTIWCGWLVWRIAVARRPALVASAAGLENRRRGWPPIPWMAIARIGATTRGRKVTSIVLHLSDAGRAEIRPMNGHVRRRLRGTLRLPTAALAMDGAILLEMVRCRHAAALARAGQVATADSDPTLDSLLSDRSRRPIVTYVLLGFLTAIFALQLVEASPEGRDGLGLAPAALVREGGLTRGALAEGAGWRLLAAPFLHVNVLHLALNAIALLYAGRTLEVLIGWRWYALVFAVSGLAGSLASATGMAADTVSVGASGGIIGLFGAMSVLAFRYPEGAVRTQMMTDAARVLFPTLLAAVPTFGLHTDLAGHCGGLAGGALAGLVILRRWRPGAATPAAGPVVTAVPVIAGAAAALALAFAVYDNALWSAFALNLPSSYGTIVQHSAGYYARFPRDPRVRYARAVALYATGRRDDAHALLQGTLDDARRLAKSPEADHLTRTLLGLIVDEDGDRAGAKAVVGPLCGTAEENIKPIVDRICR